MGGTGSVVAVIPARGGSKSIPGKNTKVLAGRPLLHWSIEAADQCSAVDATWVSTDDDRIADSVTAYNRRHGSGVQTFRRSLATATDEATSESVLLDFADTVSFDVLVFLQATNPFVTAVAVQTAVEMVQSGAFDSVLSVVRQTRFFWGESGGSARPVNYDPRARPRRQDFDGVLVENGALYVTTRAALEETECRISGRIGVVEMDPVSYHELDEPDDWVIVEQLLRRHPRRVPGNIRLVVVDCDGTLTDGGMYYTGEGDFAKRFQTRDAVGLRRLLEAGLRVAIVSGEDSAALRARAEKLGIRDCYTGVDDKLALARSLAKTVGCTLDQVCAIGDDINDLPLMAAAGYAACPADAVAEVAASAHYVALRPGGSGAVREIAEQLLAHRP